MKIATFTAIAVAVIFSDATLLNAADILSVRSAQQAIEIAAHNSPRGTPDADPKNWIANYDNKSKKWTACAGRPKSMPQSGFCMSIDARTGQIAGQEILN